MDARKIIIRADAGPNIGMGHFTRCIALSQMLNDDFHVIFATRHPSEYQKQQISQCCQGIIELGDNHYDQFLDQIKGDEIVVLDNYFYHTDYQKSIIKKGCKLVCVDDLHDKHYVSHVVINYGDSVKASDFSTAEYTQLCLGLQWALLRPPFLDAANQLPKSTHIPKQNIRVVVCFGGSDYNDLTGQVALQLVQDTRIEQINLLTGDAYTHYGSIQHPKVKYYRNISAEGVVQLFTHNDIAILAASTILLEALACHIPVMVGYWVDNQYEGYMDAVKKRLYTGLGNMNDPRNIYTIPEKLSQVKLSNVNFSGIKARYLELFHTL